MKLRYTDRSKDDVELAFAWYERQRRGLGFEFLNCVEAALAKHYSLSGDVPNSIFMFSWVPDKKIPFFYILYD